MYVFERGEWSGKDRRYFRVVDREWNNVTGWTDVKDASPFKSIPHAFWWAVVTATTVGYGDMYPTSSMGYVIASATMVFSLVILALPVGVIGGNFSKAWTKYELDKSERRIEVERDRKYVIAASTEMSTLLLVEVWNERCPVEVHRVEERPSLRDIRTRVDQAEFMGQVNLQMELRQDAPAHHSHTLRLRNSGNPDTPKRDITGTITVQYEWTPAGNGVPATVLDESQVVEDDPSSAKHGGTTDFMDSRPLQPLLRGRLKVTMIGADSLINLSYHKSKHTASNPYCMVFLYPGFGPGCASSGDHLIPCAWRSRTQLNTLHPRWNADYTWNYDWLNCDSPPPAIPKHLGRTGPPDQASGRPAQRKVDGDDDDNEDEVMLTLHRLNRDLVHLREDIQEVRGRIFRTIQPPENAVHPFTPHRTAD
jgi:hypothetical protein